MLNRKRIKNKRGEIGETLTWIIATVVIVVILAISIFTSGFAFGKKGSVDLIKTTDVLASKSFYSYLLTKDSNENYVYEKIREDKNLNEINGKLATDIFLKFYADEYDKIWIGMVSNKEGQQGLSLENKYFGKRTFGSKEEFNPLNPQVSESIKLDDENDINLLLYGKNEKE